MALTLSDTNAPVPWTAKMKRSTTFRSMDKLVIWHGWCTVVQGLAVHNINDQPMSRMGKRLAGLNTH
jgi:hypothetical protein